MSDNITYPACVGTDTSGTMERRLRKSEYLNGCGTWVYLGDGEKWCISSLPLGSRCNEILAPLEKLYILQENLPETGAKTVEILKHTKEMADASASFMFVLLQVNYPKLERKYFDETPLVTMQHSAIFQRIIQGTTGLNEIIGAPKDGEDEKKT